MPFREYVQHGWAICSLEKGSKGPTYKGWNTKSIPLDAAEGLEGAGLLHSLSKTCALDIDDLSTARTWLAERGVDLDALLAADDAVAISSGTPNRAKLLFKMTRPLRTLNPKGSGLELRCATADGKSVHDALPPSTHPSGRQYVWAGGILSDWRAPPTVPAALLSLWRDLDGPDEQPLPEKEYVPIDIAKLRKAAFQHSPDCEYPEWLRVGMQLHDGSDGTQEGLDIWMHWSRGIKRKPYPGDVTLKSHWLSFSSAPGKRVASGKSLTAELPADAEDFPLIEGNAYLEEEMGKAAVATTLAEFRKQAVEQLAQATLTLEERLVFVRTAERYFDTQHHTIIGSDNAIEHMFTAIMPRTKGSGRSNPVKLLKASTSKRLVDSLAFHPGEGAIFTDTRGQYANLYLNQLPDPIEPTVADLDRIRWLFDRIDDVPYRDWFLQFLAHTIQKPGVKIRSAPLIWSETQGNGKTTLVKNVPALLVGDRYSQDVTYSLLNSDHNDYLTNAWHVNLKEFRAGTRGEREAISKKVEDWIADDTLSMHPKGTRGYTAPNHLFVTASSNKDDAAAIDNNDRKWAIHELHAPKMTDSEVNWIYHEFLLTPRSAAVLRHYFLNLSLSGFQPNARAIETEARQAMVESSVPPDYEMLLTAFEQHSEPLHRDVIVTEDVAEYARRHCVSRPSAKRVGRMLCKAPFNGTARQWIAGEGRYRGVVLRNKGKWLTAPGPEVMEYISSGDVDLLS